ncbi:MAG: calcium-translocating P-type ATPase, PMCA-type [Bacilli bacterium]|nr:calcium-translocating P-type ATPase, PMCA-type [Bacilli bacterium]
MEHTGLSDVEVIENRKKYGKNSLTEIKKKSFFSLFLESLGDPIIKILLIALAVKVIFLFKDFDYFETLGILIAVLIASFISTISEYGSEETFKKLQEEQESQKVKVKRNNQIVEIKLEEVVVGDLILLESGDSVPSDGFLIEGSLYVDESKLNGETREQKKEASKTLEEKSKLLRGMNIYEGKGMMLSQKVGDQTLYGNLAKEIQEEEPDSPLKTRLFGLAKTISKIGYIGAFLVTFSYLFSVLVMDNHFEISAILSTITNPRVLFDHLIYALTLSVTIIVVAVPEGLPMMITLVLSSNMKKMLKSNVLVRKLVGIETAGSLNILFTDKTGTITKGKLEVTEIVLAEGNHLKSEKDIKNNSVKDTLEKSMGWNNSSSKNKEGKSIGGNATDRALLSFFKSKIEKERILKETPFNSKEKYSSIEIEENNKRVTYYKGASEILLKKCNKYMTSSGEIKNLYNKSNLENQILLMTRKGTRVITLAKYSDNNFIFIAFVALKDEIRKEAKKGVELIQDSGIQVVMITGDARETATSIAKEVGILKEESDLVLSSTEFNSYSNEELLKILPKIKVIARALPQDKSKLVKIAQQKDLIVGMTGDGVNDAPALKKANVGFAMGSGCEVAKEASDIVILDDNILSISDAILYGRTIFKSIRKFIIYQLTCNFCALFLSIIGPFIGVSTPITIIQMLWINMIMDTFAGLAFSFEPALKETMKEPPKRKDEPILNKYMYSEIIFTGLYSALLCIFFLKSPWIKGLIRMDSNQKYFMTAYFALFIFIGIGNAFNARTHRLNILAHLHENSVFLITFLFIACVQMILIYKGGVVFRTFGLTPFELMLVLILAFTVIPCDFIRKKILQKKGIHLGV